MSEEKFHFLVPLHSSRVPGKEWEPGYKKPGEIPWWEALEPQAGQNTCRDLL
jgi:hypothetical protein